jgi:subtilisin family serine protease
MSNRIIEEVLLIGFICCLCAALVLAQEAIIKLNTHTIDTRDGNNHFDMFSDNNTPRLMLIQFKKPLTTQLIEHLSLNIDVFHVHNSTVLMDSQTVIARVSASSLKAYMDKFPSVIQWNGLMKAEYKKMSQLSRLDAFEIPQVRQNSGNTLVKPHVPLILNLLENNKIQYEQIVEQWKKELQIVCGTQLPFDLRLVSKYKALLTLYTRSVSNAEEVFHFLTSRSEIIWIERQLPMDKLNYAENMIVQSGTGVVKDNFIWKQGYTGKGQIVGIGDTGIDWDNCYFSDGMRPPAFQSVDLNHRKIVGYYTVTAFVPGTSQTVTTDHLDSVDGHGSHCAGSLAGSADAWNINTTYAQHENGAAIDAKLIFIDLEGTEYPGMVFPNDLVDGYFGVFAAAGARIVSSSWGGTLGSIFSCRYDCNCTWNVNYPPFKKGDPINDYICLRNFGARCCNILNQYNSQCQEVDRVTHSFDEMLLVFAAGNDGGASNNGTVVPPGTSKNALTVGASTTTNEQLIKSIYYEDIYRTLHALGLNTESQCCNFTYPDSYMVDEVKMACCSEYMKSTFSNSKLYNENNLATFSSRGPTTDFRIKPDIVAPGYNIISGHSDGRIDTFQCGMEQPAEGNNAGLMSMKGTSMATPLVAGTAALVRQYFSLNYPSHAYPGSPASNTLSGTLIKATIIQSGSPMNGSVILSKSPLIVKDLSTLPIPNPFFGFGLINIKSVLPFAEAIQRKEQELFQLYVVNRDVVANNRPEVLYQLNVTPSPTSGKCWFKTTLVWYDREGSPALSKQLIHDLDLEVFVVNTRTQEKQRYPGNNVPTSDIVNTVEQVTLQNNQLRCDGYERIIVRVSAKQLYEGTQTYSLVMTGVALTPLQ